ncbi:MAG: hypothetical protein ACD_45C00465G0008, partial [uncultured bacterium]
MLKSRILRCNGYNRMMRKANEADIAQLVDIEQVTQQDPWSYDIFVHCLATGCHCWVMEENNQIIGFILISLASPDEAHILNLGVRPAYQGKGVGRTLLEYILLEVKQHKMRMIYLEVRRSNEKALNLYRKLGFVEISERKNYYAMDHGREDALVMAKELI